MRFSSIPGHPTLKARLLRSAREQRVAHAQLFHGDEGAGALPLALAYANYLNCTERKETDSCGHCPACLKYDKLVHPDLHFVFPVAGSGRPGRQPVSDDFLEEWRKALIENPYLNMEQWFGRIGMQNKQGNIYVSESNEIVRKLNLKSFEAAYKVMIIWMAEKMNQQAASKLLKMIEEPPPMTVFVLVAEETGNMLPTILSRAQHIRIPGMEENAILEILRSTRAENGSAVEEQELRDAARLAGGSVNRARDLLSAGENGARHLELFKQLMRLAYKPDIVGLAQWVEEVGAWGREPQKSFLAYAIRLMRENLLMNQGQEALNRMSGIESDFSRNFHPFIHPGNAPAIIEALNEASRDIEANAYARIVLHDFALSLVKLIR